VKLCDEPVRAKSVYSAVDRAFKHTMTSELSGDGGDLSPYHVVKLKSLRISSQSAATLRIFVMNLWWPELGAYTLYILIGGKWGVWTVVVIHHPFSLVCGLKKCTLGHNQSTFALLLHV